MATHSSILAWKIPWMAEPGRLQSMGSQRVGHDWATFFLFYKRRRNRTRVISKAVTFSERSILEWSVYHHSGWTMIPLEVLILKPLENLKSSRICYFSLKITVIRASLVAQLVKNPPAVWETWVWSLGWEDLHGMYGISSHCNKRFSYMNLFKSQNSHRRWALLVFPFYR